MHLSEEQRLIRDTARSFAQDVLAPQAASNDAQCQFPRDAIRQMGQLGFMGMLVPEHYGGSFSDNVSYALALEEIAAGDGACSTIMSVHNSVGCMPLLQYGSEQQKQSLLPSMASGEKLGAFCLTEPGAGSDASAIVTKAVANNDGFELNGVKQFITSGSSAELAIVFARTGEGKRGISAFIVHTDNPGYEVARVEKKLGQRASETCQIRLHQCQVPHKDCLGETGEGYRIALSNLEGARLMTHRAALLRDQNKPCLVEASMAKLFASEMAEKVCSEAIQIHGGYGYLQDYAVERIARDVRVCQLYEGTSEIQRIVISRALPGRTD